MEAMRESWTDDRLDHLSQKVGERFDRVDERFKQVDERFRQIDGRFDRVEAEARGLRSEMIEFRSEMNARFDSMQRLMIQFFGVMAAALIGFVATQA
jgi:archaellum component FlaC